MRPLVSAVLLVSLALTPALVAAQPLVWEPVSLTTADVRALSVLPNGDVYVASRGGLQRSFDGGASWSFWLTTSDVSGVAYAPGHVLFVGSDGLCRGDSGPFACGSVRAWGDLGGGSLVLGASIGPAADSGSSLAGLVAAPDGRGWAAIGNDVWVYPGAEEPWERSELPVDVILGLHRGTSGRLYAPTTDGLFVRDPDVESGGWARLGLEGHALTSVFEAADGTVFAGSVAGVVFRSDPNGVRWREASVASAAILALYADTSAEHTFVLAGTAGDGLFRSTDAGATWEPAATNGAIVPALGGGGSQWAAVEGDGLRRSDDGGRSWRPIRWSNIRTEHVEAGPEGLVLAGDSGPYGLFAYARTTDTWRPSGLGRDEGHPSRTIDDVAAAPDGRFYAAVSEFVGGVRRSVLYRSIDGGASWDAMHTFPERGAFGSEGLVHTLAAGPDGVLVAGTGPAAAQDEDPIALLYRSDDGGMTWEEVATFDAYSVESLAFGSDGTAYAGTGFDTPEIFRSDDGGQTWTGLGPVATGESVQTAKALVVTDDGAVVAALNAEGTYRSTDRGATWHRVLDRNHWAMTGFRADGILAGGTGVRLSTDGGQTWEETGIEHPFVRDVAVDAFGTAYAAFSRHGLFRSTGTLVASEPGAQAEGASLEAYPNPFAQTTTVHVTLDAARDLEVAVYDVLGRRVAVLHRGALPAGDHPIAFDRQTLPSGVYIVRVTGERLALSRRVLLVR